MSMTWWDRMEKDRLAQESETEQRIKTYANLEKSGKASGAAEAYAACAALCREAEPEILELLKQHNWDMNRPNGRQTWYSQREFARKIAVALASRIEARGAGGGKKGER